MSAWCSRLIGLWELYGVRALNWLSYIIFLSGVIVVFVLRRTDRLSGRLLWATTAELFAVMLVEIAESLSPDFPIRTLQAFSLDASYTAMTAQMTTFVKPWLNNVFHVYRILLYCLAPVLGGAVIYDVLAGVSPALRLVFMCHRELYVFSALNEKSVMLAVDLHRSFVTRRSLRRPAIVFTDCGEGDSEWKQQAESIRAICLEEDLFHIRSLWRSRRCTFLLMDIDEHGEPDDLRNVSTLQRLLETRPRIWNKKHGCAIYIVSNDSEAAENIRSVKACFDASAEKEKMRVSVRIVRDYARSCCGHLSRHPLFEGLKQGEALDLVLLGWTPFAREMFKTLFWLGQITDHPLHICVASRPGDGVERELQNTCPELLKSCIANDPCLRIRAEGDYAPPYASLCFVETDWSETSMSMLLNTEHQYQYGETDKVFRLSQARRFFVMPGVDEENIAAAGALRRALTHAWLGGDVENATTAKKANKDAKIDVLVENDALSRLAIHRFPASQEEEALPSPEVLLFGSLAQRYCREVLTPDDLRFAEGDRSERHVLRGIAATKDEIYNDWAIIARAFHMKTKMYCLGAEGQNEYEEKLDFQRKMQPYEQTDVDLLRWLEHRRWCAYLRTEGFAAPPGLDKRLEQASKISSTDRIMLRSYLAGEKIEIEALEKSIESSSGLKLSGWKTLRAYSTKDVPARLHPCLVECLPYNNEPDKETDRLDLVETLRLVVKAGEHWKPVKKEWGNASAKEKPRLNLIEKRRKEGAPKKTSASTSSPPRPHREAKSVPNGVKKYDSPYGEYGPTLDRTETYAYLRGKEPEKTPPTNYQWRKLLQEWSELPRCRCTREDERYYLDLLEDIKKEAAEKQGEAEEKLP